MVVATSVSRKMWFGTREHAEWIETPLSGAEVSPQTWSAGGTLLNGGGWQKNAEGSHKVYNYSWRNSSARQAAQRMQSYRDGDYGTGLIHFIDPLTYNTNVLPKGWAAPHLTTNGGYPSLVPGVTPTRNSMSWSAGSQNGHHSYPSGWASYVLPTGTQTQFHRLFLPIPPDYSLFLGAVYNSTASVAIRGRRVKLDGSLGPEFTLQSTAAYDERLCPLEIVGNGDAGIEIYIGKTGVNSAQIDIKAMTARVQPSFKAPDAIQRGPWVGGQGHSGVRFEGAPTYIEYNGVGGGQVGYAATFREVGAWE